MRQYLPREKGLEVIQRLQTVPVVALLGPRQCGKSTLAKEILKQFTNAVYLDLDRPSDIAKLQDPELFLSQHQGRLVCIDEVQNRPNLFQVLRSIVDDTRLPGQFFILGSASRDLLKQSTQTLAGRISYLELTPLSLLEVSDFELKRLWLRGGFPDSFLSESDAISSQWRLDFIRTFLERDIPSFGFGVPSGSIHRLWRMLAHVQGHTLNASKIGQSLDKTNKTVRDYIDILSELFMVRLLEPFEINIKKRLVKSPKTYIRDTGLLHQLLGIVTFDELLGHPIYGFSWETFVLESVITHTPDWEHFFFSTSTQNEIDLIVQKGTRRIAIECKASTAPTIRKSLHTALDDTQTEECYIVAPITDSYPIHDRIRVVSLQEMLHVF